MSQSDNSTPNVFSIPPGEPFLHTFIKSLSDGELVRKINMDDPFGFSDVTIWVPTQRAARQLATEMLECTKYNAMLLPNIKTLGDVDDELYSDDQNEQNDGEEKKPNETEVVTPLERQIELATLIAQWTKNINKNHREITGEDEALVASSVGDAFQFAGELIRLMDMVETQEVKWDELNNITPENHAKWWELTTNFLKIATQHWPNRLIEKNKLDPKKIEIQKIKKQTEIYKNQKKQKKQNPVIVVGSTGSVPATAELIKTIAYMKNSAVVLPGLDRSMDEKQWNAISEDQNPSNHPQYSLKNLIEKINIKRNEIKILGGNKPEKNNREDIISQAMLPPMVTAEPKQKNKAAVNGFQNVTLVEASGEREEALAVAIAMKEIADDKNKNKNVALVTPDRTLARRVATELKRFNLNVDDSAGQQLSQCSAGTFARLAVRFSFQEFNSVTLADLIKHRYTNFGKQKDNVSVGTKVIELAILRYAMCEQKNFSSLETFAKELKNELPNQKYAPNQITNFLDEQWEQAYVIAKKIDQMRQVADVKVDGNKQAKIKDVIEATIKIVEQVSHDGEKFDAYQKEDGKILANLLGELMDQDDILKISPRQWPDMFDAILSTRAVRVPFAHPRLVILGPLEARLQTYDRIILGGLNEKIWPANARNDPFLSRPMKTQMKLPLPEWRTGLAAHDFQMLLGADDVILTRARRTEGTPTIASRWLQRTLLVAGEEARTNMTEKGMVYAAKARQLDHPQTDLEPNTQPQPKPPVEDRPKKLSVTEIERLIRDPYSIYAKHILRLQPINSLRPDTDIIERGNLYHAIFEEFIQNHADKTEQDAINVINEIADKLFDECPVTKPVKAQWRPRFNTIAENFAKWHLGYWDNVQKSIVEAGARYEWKEVGFTLSGKADRIDVMTDGTLAIFDYKTGAQPTKNSMKRLEAPQLPLEAVLAQYGAFKGVPKNEVSEIAYIRLRPDDELKIDGISLNNEDDVQEIAQDAEEELISMIKKYKNKNTPYVSKARIIRDREWITEYDHLARVREWSLIGQDKDE